MRRTVWTSLSLTVLLVVSTRTVAASELALSSYLGGSGHDEVAATALLADGSTVIAGFTLSPDLPTVAALDAQLDGDSDAFVARIGADGEVLFATYLGGSGVDVVVDLAVGADGTLFLFGQTSSPDFPLVAGVPALQSTLASDGNPEEPAIDTFLVAMRDDGSELRWSTYLGGRRAEFAIDVEIGDDDLLTLAGTTLSPDFPLLRPLDRRLGRGRHPAPSDVFLTRVDPWRHRLVFSTYFGGSEAEVPGAIAVAPDGATIVVGSTSSYDFPLRRAAQRAHGEEPQAFYRDGFVAKLSPDGRRLLYSTYLAGNGTDSVNAVTLDADGTVLAAGSSSSLELPVGGPLALPPSGGFDGFLVRLAADGSAFLEGSYFGGSRNDSIERIERDGAARVHLVGWTDSPDLPTTPDGFDATCGASGDCGLVDPSCLDFPEFCQYQLDLFVATVDVTLGALETVSYFGGAGWDFPGGSAWRDGRLLLGGFSDSDDLPTANATQAQPNGEFDAFFTLFPLATP